MQYKPTATTITRAWSDKIHTIPKGALCNSAWFWHNFIFVSNHWDFHSLHSLLDPNSTEKKPSLWR